MHTYFATEGNKSALKFAEDRRTLHVWSAWWSMAGFKPVVLTEDDARRHPAFAELRQAYSRLPTVNSPHYELACFLRCAAMAAAGGGWLSDYDTLPLSMCAPAAYDGAFTTHDRHVPSLVSGDAAEWDRVARQMAELPWREHERHFSVGARSHVSDMLSLAHLARSGKVRTRVCDIISAAEIFGQNVRWLLCTARRAGCKEDVAPLAVHFSHSAIRGLMRRPGVMVRPPRAWVMNQTLAEYTEKCTPRYVPSRVFVDLDDAAATHGHASHKFVAPAKT